jgi:hypothetical protein
MAKPHPHRPSASRRMVASDTQTAARAPDGLALRLIDVASRRHPACASWLLASPFSPGVPQCPLAIHVGRLCPLVVLGPSISHPHVTNLRDMLLFAVVRGCNGWSLKHKTPSTGYVRQRTGCPPPTLMPQTMVACGASRCRVCLSNVNAAPPAALRAHAVVNICARHWRGQPYCCVLL